MRDICPSDSATSTRTTTTAVSSQGLRVALIGTAFDVYVILKRIGMLG